MNMNRAGLAWPAFLLDLRERDGSAPLPGVHKCCGEATLVEDLALNPAGACTRRFLDTPLHVIIAS
jgi:hypothetical protein